ncbi:hypothetical protein TNCV_2837471 [Trichonephila clavipes]|nr:hypothetical protein TNCV_2837471 [Trichonephila clavipes]
MWNPEESTAIDDGNVCREEIMTDKNILGYVQSSRNIFDANSDDENGTNNAALVPKSSEMRNIMESMLSYLDAYVNGK